MSENRENKSINDTNRFDDEIFIALFRKGAHEYLENDLIGDLSERKDKMESGLSEAAEKKIKKMINQAIRKEKNRRIVKRFPRIVAIVLIVIVICSITVMSVEAFRVPFLNLFVRTEEKITDIEFDQDQANDDVDSLTDMFGYIPDGYELTFDDMQEQDTTFIFTNEREESIFINKFNGKGNYGVDTEGAEYDEIMINEYQGFYSIKNGLATLVFTKNGYAYSISASIDLTEIIKIAENIK